MTPCLEDNKFMRRCPTRSRSVCFFLRIIAGTQYGTGELAIRPGPSDTCGLVNIAAVPHRNLISSLEATCSNRSFFGFGDVATGVDHVVVASLATPAFVGSSTVAVNSGSIRFVTHLCSKAKVLWAVQPFAATGNDIQGRYLYFWCDFCLCVGCVMEESFS
jgi:hypothetical protein